MRDALLSLALPPVAASWRVVRFLLSVAPLALLVACSSDDGGGGGGGAGAGGSASIDPCKVVTQSDATTLFEKPAVPDHGTLVTDPAYIGDCFWSWETPDMLGSQSLAFYLWDGEAYYAPSTSAVPFTIGDAGAVESSAGAGVDVLWHQDGVAAILSYFTVGTGVPNHLTKVEEVKALALKASSRF